jgi:hypothetical protein
MQNTSQTFSALSTKLFHEMTSTCCTHTHTHTKASILTQCIVISLTCGIARLAMVRPEMTSDLRRETLYSDPH